MEAAVFLSCLSDPAPATGHIEALVTKPTGDPEPRNWRQLLQRVPLDPWGELYIYRPQGDGFAITSKGPDRQEGNVDDVTLASSASENK
jgi:type II secretion system protein G